MQKTKRFQANFEFATTHLLLSSPPKHHPLSITIRITQNVETNVQEQIVFWFSLTQDKENMTPMPTPIMQSHSLSYNSP